MLLQVVVRLSLSRCAFIWCVEPWYNQSLSLMSRWRDLRVGRGQGVPPLKSTFTEQLVLVRSIGLVLRKP